MIKPTSHFSRPRSLGQLEYVSGMSILVIALLTLSVLLVLITIFLGWIYQDLVPDSEFTIVILLFGGIPLLCGVYGLKYILNNQSVKVYKNGFVHKSGQEVQTVFWNDIEEFYEKIVLLIIHGVPVKKREYTITVNSGHTIVLEQNIRKVAKIGQRIKEETFKSRFTDAYERILNGQVLEFGSVTLTKNIITIMGDEIYLDRTKKVKSLNGKIVIKGNSVLGGSEIDYSKTPNAHVLYALLMKLINEKSTRVAP